MTELSIYSRHLGSHRRDGWAFPYVNFAGAGYRYNLGARPRTSWDFNAKIHDMMSYANGLSFSLQPPTDNARRSRLAKADYIFRQLSQIGDQSIPEKILNRLSKFVFLGRDKTDFINNDNFDNVIYRDELSVANGHFMIPWSEIPNSEQREIEDKAREKAKEIFNDCSLTLIRKKYGINVDFRRKMRAGRRVKESVNSRKKRIINDIYCELKYNQVASIDTKDWKNWAAIKFGTFWDEVIDIS